jgi:hypothetical protein
MAYDAARQEPLMFGGDLNPLAGSVVGDTWAFGAVCGDGVVEGAEDCDTSGVDTPTCDGGDCSAMVCGDGYVNAAAGEQCDPPSASANTVSSNCLPGCVNDPSKVPTVSEWGMIAMTVLGLLVGAVMSARRRAGRGIANYE